MDAIEEVRAANGGFYRAFESLALDRMDAVWAHEGQVLCVHPGWPLAAGWTEVRETWRTIFENTAAIRFDIDGERIDVRGDLAWVVCVERLLSSAGGGEGEGAVLATNVFRREGHGWRMVHHHASPHVERAEPGTPRVVN